MPTAEEARTEGCEAEPCWEAGPEGVKVPYAQASGRGHGTPSSIGHEESGVNQRGPYHVRLNTVVDR